ncbi:prkA serine kinase C-terminal domain protein, partial [Vibrio parahaemolyticus AQ3810]
KPRT